MLAFLRNTEIKDVASAREKPPFWGWVCYRRELFSGSVLRMSYGESCFDVKYVSVFQKQPVVCMMESVEC